jgi:hypothetical protein
LKIQESDCQEAWPLAHANSPANHTSPRRFQWIESTNSLVPKLLLCNWIGNCSSCRTGAAIYCRSYSPFPTFFNTVNPALLASETESGFSFVGEFTREIILRTGLRHSGHFVRGARDAGLRKLNFPPQTLQSPSQSSYS